jgi:HEPN domain-containing protein
MNDLTHEWVILAEGDYRYAIIGMRAKDTSVYNGVCFHCQQAAEKYLKAFLVEHQIEFRPKHDLLYLLNLALNVDAAFEFIRMDLEFLNDYAVDVRYPGESADKTEAR